jgi:hypothetical protein
MNPPVKLSDLIFALESDSEEIETYFDRHTGLIVRVEGTVLSAVKEGDDEELTDLPDWQKEEVETARAIADDAGDRFIDPPGKFEFHEYRHMESFIRSLPEGETAEELWRAIKGRGAFRYFKDTLYRLGIQDSWYRYRDAAMKEFVIEWAVANNVPYQDDTKDPHSSKSPG